MMVKIIYSTYENVDLEEVAANTTQINAQEIIQLLGLLKDLGSF